VGASEDGLLQDRNALTPFAGRSQAKILSVYLGHASITVTIDCYGHLFPGNESEADALLDAYLESALRE
jgi:integrase